MFVADIRDKWRKFSSFLHSKHLISVSPSLKTIDLQIIKKWLAMVYFHIGLVYRLLHYMSSKIS